MLLYVFVCAWWRHQMETASALLAICAGNSPVTGEFPAQRPVTQSFDVFFDLRLNKRFNKQRWGWWFETPSRPLWRHCNAPTNSGTKAVGVQVMVLLQERNLSALLGNNRCISQIPQCIRQISHNAPHSNRNVHACAHFCYKVVHFGIWDRRIVGFVRLIFPIQAPDSEAEITISS